MHGVCSPSISLTAAALRRISHPTHGYNGQSPHPCLLPPRYQYPVFDLRRCGPVGRSARNGPTALVMLILPAALHMLELSPPNQFEDWVKAILGQEMNNCNPSDELHELVLQIVSVYQVFYYNLNDEDSCALFHLFAEQLRTAVLTLDDHQPTERALARLIDWAHTILPPGVFWKLDPPSPQGPPSASATNAGTSKSTTDPVPAARHSDEGTTRVSPTTGAIAAELASMLGLAAVSSVQDTTLRDTPDVMRSCSSTTSTTVGDSEASFVMVAVHPVPGEQTATTDSEGYGSDDSMLPLVTPTDSSDDKN
ncbi:hypothetical protein C8Q76DRAFT_692057 [Earliella scabrosa]|nr:hypothetical protein C8Q76DRAFT_692057 [Earliella scabrosa]